MPDGIALFFAGLLAGEELAVCYGVRPTLRGPEQIALRQALIRRLRLLVPLLFAATFVTGAVAWHATRSPLRLAGLAALLLFMMVTFAGTVPINKAALAWNPAAPPPDWRERVARWERLDIVRCWLALAAFALFCAA
jgi:uncharacterized membrane protein